TCTTKKNLKPWARKRSDPGGNGPTIRTNFRTKTTKPKTADVRLAFLSHGTGVRIPVPLPGVIHFPRRQPRPLAGAFLVYRTDRRERDADEQRRCGGRRPTYCHGH